METTSPPLALASEHGSRRSRAGAGVWRKLAPVHGLLFLISFYLVLSLGYIIFYSQTFRLGKRIVVLHLAVVCGLLLRRTLGV